MPNLDRGDHNDLVPEKLEDIDAEWLTRALATRHPRVVVESLSVEDGTRGTTTRLRLSARYRGPGGEELPRELFLKTSFASDVHHDYTASLGILEAEVRFYRELAPKLPVPTPRVLVSEIDERTGGFVVVMENLAAAGARWGYATRPLGRAAVDNTIAHVAALHAPTWESSEIESLPWLQSIDSGALSKSFLEHTAPNTINAPRLDSLRGSTADVPRLIEGFRKLQRLNGRSPRCLLHGDLHLGNLAFRGDEPVFTDWQIVRKGHWAYDLGYFLPLACRIDDRRAWERDVLQQYLEHLRSRGVTPPTFEEAWESYRLQPIHGLVMFVNTPDTMQTEEVNRTYLERFVAAAEDLGSLDALAAA